MFREGFILPACPCACPSLNASRLRPGDASPWRAGLVGAAQPAGWSRWASDGEQRGGRVRCKYCGLFTKLGVNHTLERSYYFLFASGRAKLFLSFPLLLVRDGALSPLHRQGGHGGRRSTHRAHFISSAGGPRQGGHTPSSSTAKPTSTPVLSRD